MIPWHLCDPLPGDHTSGQLWPAMVISISFWGTRGFDHKHFQKSINQYTSYIPSYYCILFPISSPGLAPSRNGKIQERNSSLESIETARCPSVSTIESGNQLGPNIVAFKIRAGVCLNQKQARTLPSNIPYNDFKTKGFFWPNVDWNGFTT